MTDGLVVFVSSDYLAVPDPVTTMVIDKEQENEPHFTTHQLSSVRRRKRLGKYPSSVFDAKREENFSRNLFHSAKKLREGLGVSSVRRIHPHGHLSSV